MLRAESVNHVSIPVNDIERAKKFYVELLGMKELPPDPGERREGGPRPEFSAAGRLGVPHSRPCRLECGGLEVTLFQRPKPIDRDLVQENGLFHNSFRMDWNDLRRMAADIKGLRRAGYNIPCEPVYRDVPGNENISLYVIDTEGNLFELVGRPSDSDWRTPGA